MRHMLKGMTAATQQDQVLEIVVRLLEVAVVHAKILRRAARLTAMLVALSDKLADLCRKSWRVCNH